MRILAILCLAAFCVCCLAPGISFAKEKPVAVIEGVAVGVDPKTGTEVVETEEADIYLEKANENFMAGNMKKASHEIKKAAAYLEKQSAKASQATKDAFHASAAQLKKLAQDVKAGTIKTADDLKAKIDAAYHKALPKKAEKK